MTQTQDPTASSGVPQRHLTLFDSTSIIVGIIIGSSIYESTPLIAGNVSGPWGMLGVWALGGLLSLFGALCYTELATTYPKEGGDYVYLTRAFGRRMGFVFGWSQLWIVRPGAIGAMAFVFARYANQLWPLEGHLSSLGGLNPSLLALLIYAVGSLLVLTGINIMGVQQGKWTQNLLTVAKFLGLVALCVVGLLYASPTDLAKRPLENAREPDFGLAMILVLFAYGGWNEMAYVGSEVRNPRKNILRALLLGTVAVMACYLVANVAFLHALGFEGIRQSEAVAATVMGVPFGEAGRRFISVLIAVSALGAVNGQIFTGARIYYAMGTEHKLYGLLGRWNRRSGSPVWSLVIQLVITLIPVIGFGLAEGAFEKLIVFTTPFYWVFMMLVALSLYQLREVEPTTVRPYRVPGYPFIPFIFAVSALFVLYRGVLWAYVNAHVMAYWSIGILALGILLAFFDPKPVKGLENLDADRGD